LPAAAAGLQGSDAYPGVPCHDFIGRETGGARRSKRRRQMQGASRATPPRRRDDCMFRDDSG